MTTYINYDELNGIQMMPDEVEFMVNVIKTMPKNGTFVEWGSGGSTCKWLETLSDSQKLITIEHNRGWYDKVSTSINNYFNEETLKKLLYIYAPEAIGYAHGYGSIEEENPFGLWQYVYPNIKIKDADVFFIDGIGRGACLALILLTRTNKDSRIFIHDYTLRTAAYGWITQVCNVNIVGTTLAEIKFG